MSWSHIKKLKGGIIIRVFDNLDPWWDGIKAHENSTNNPGFSNNNSANVYSRVQSTNNMISFINLSKLRHNKMHLPVLFGFWWWSACVWLIDYNILYYVDVVCWKKISIGIMQLFVGMKALMKIWIAMSESFTWRQWLYKISQVMWQMSIWSSSLKPQALLLATLDSNLIILLN